MNKKLIVAAIASFACSIAMADTLSDFTKEFKARFPQAQAAKVIEVDPGRFYAVVDGGKVIFIDEKMSYLFDGTLIELKTNQNLTQKLTDENRPKLDVSKLNLKNAIQVKKANSKNVIYVFSDPVCPYCQKLEQSFDELTDVNIYIFPLPLESIHPNALSVTKHILCSENPANTWHSYLTKREMAANKQSSCDMSEKISANQKLAQEFGIMGTPAIIFSDGEVIPGAVPAATINSKLAALK